MNLQYDRTKPFQAMQTTSLSTREAVRCACCHLVQFMTDKKRCRRCRITFIPAALPVQKVSDETPQQRRALPHIDGGVPPIAAAVRLLRNAFEFSQRDLAKIMNVPRTYVSKIENEKCTPTLSSVEHLASAFGMTSRLLILTAVELDKQRSSGTVSA